MSRYDRAPIWEESSNINWSCSTRRGARTTCESPPDSSVRLLARWKTMSTISMSIPPRRRHEYRRRTHAAKEKTSKSQEPEATIEETKETKIVIKVILHVRVRLLCEVCVTVQRSERNENIK